MRRAMKYVIIISATLGFIGIVWQVLSSTVNYRFFEYGNQKYYPDSNLNIRNTIIYDENGEFCDYENCTEVVVKINGWFPRKMLLYNSGEKRFVFDTVSLVWCVKNGESSYPSCTAENLSGMFVDFWGDSEDHCLVTEQVKEVCDVYTNLSCAETERIKWEEVPNEERNGTIDVSYKGFPDDVIRSLLYFSATEEDVFFMLLAEEGWGRFCILPLET